MNSPNPALVIDGISKSYNVPVLTSVRLELLPGEVHALVGANGAGKSTLARVICGLTRPDSGRMLLDGRPYAPSGKGVAEAAGVHIVQQELNLIPTLTVGENLFLNRLPRRFGFVARKQLAAGARKALDAVGLYDVFPEMPVAKLGIGRQQLVEIASALSRNLRLLILDEPTAMLTQPETQILFARIAELKARGVTVIYISHRMEEILSIADRVSALRDGQVVATSPVAETSVESMVAAMTGTTAKAGGGESRLSRNESREEQVALQVSNLTRGTLTRDVSFSVNRGEIFGLAGLVGSGRTETLRAIFGADVPEKGTVAVGSPLRQVRIRSPRDGVQAGIGMLPEDRKAQGLLLSQSIATNVTLAKPEAISLLGGWLLRQREHGVAEEYVSRLDVRCRSARQTVGELSGGNQQKVLLARWLLRDCDVLLFDEPTRGIDISARFSIYGVLRELAAAGKAIVVASSDFEELEELCDRIGVMSAGRLAAVFGRGEWTEDRILAASFSEYNSARSSGAPGVQEGSGV